MGSMKLTKLITSLVIALAACLPAYAQTTYTLNTDNFSGPVYSGRSASTVYYAADMPLTDGASINETFVAAGFSCPNQDPPHFGSIVYTIDGVETDCIPLTSLSFGTFISDSTVINGRTYHCNGPSTVHGEFAGGTFDAEMSYYYVANVADKNMSGCYQKTTSATLTIK
jgi:hypothetical protein